MARTATVVFALAAGSAAGFTTNNAPSWAFPETNFFNDEITVLISAEPRAGSSWLANILMSTLEEHCSSQPSCHFSVKDAIALERTGNYSIMISTWPGSRRMVSTAMKFTVPNVGHANDMDWSNFPELSSMDFDAKVDKTRMEIPAGGKYIVLLRDPRDVAMSACYAEAAGCSNPDDYVKNKIAPIALWTGLRYKFFEAVRGDREGQVMIVFYEDLITDPRRLTGEIAEFIKAPVDDNAIRQVVGRAYELSEKKSKPTARKAPLACGFTQELQPETSQFLYAAMMENLPRALANRWACGGR